MQRTVVINVVGLSESLLGPHTPAINAFRQAGALATIAPAFPAVTCTAQSNYVTGAPPSQHGIVANGWYDRSLAEVQFWKQSNHLVAAPKIWDELRARDPRFTCAKLFWWYNMYSTADWSITPRPMYPADGRKFFDIYAWPYALRPEIKKDLGEFPFPGFWGPAAGVDTPQGKADSVSRWVADSAKWVEEKNSPTLSLVYLPHLDYNLQRLGPGGAIGGTSYASPHSADQSGTRVARPSETIARDLRLIDAIFGDLIAFYQKRGVQVLLLSEYGITAVNQPIHLNRLFRSRGWLTVKEELGLELLDAGASKAFAVADHQVAHIYVNDRNILNDVRSLLEKTDGIAQVMGDAEKTAAGIAHPRAGDLIAVAKENAWFTYYYWLDDARAPDFARCVDIHRKPGYDPVELFLDPKIPAVKLKILSRLLQKKLGFRMLMDVIPLDASLVKGSHGCAPADRREWPLVIAEKAALLPKPLLNSTDIYSVIKSAVIS
ncbi:MAG: alkaline phosphatase family protein [Verrucomicrobia bacterium]|nr:alkaline phosphatase family protein [Verrucomicrobiota bacterium]